MWPFGRQRRRYNRDWGVVRALKGAAYGLLAAVVFVGVVVVMYLVFQAAQPYVADAAQELFETQAYQSLEESVRELVSRVR